MSEKLPVLLAPHDVATWLSLPVSRVMRMVKRGEIPSLTLPSGELVFDQAELAAWLKSLRGQAHHPSADRSGPVLIGQAVDEVLQLRGLPCGQTAGRATEEAGAAR